MKDPVQRVTPVEFHVILDFRIFEIKKWESYVKVVH